MDLSLRMTLRVKQYHGTEEIALTFVPPSGLTSVARSGRHKMPSSGSTMSVVFPQDQATQTPGRKENQPVDVRAFTGLDVTDCHQYASVE